MNPPPIPTVELTLDISVSPPRSGFASLSVIPAFGDDCVLSTYILNLDAFAAALSNPAPRTVPLLMDDSGMNGAGEMRYFSEHTPIGWVVSEQKFRASGWGRRSRRSTRGRMWCCTWSSVADAIDAILAARDMLRAAYPSCDICAGSVDGDPISGVAFDRLSSISIH